jgi:hypothetical protein
MKEIPSMFWLVSNILSFLGSSALCEGVFSMINNRLVKEEILVAHET